jgi:hypothetical protein
LLRVQPAKLNASVNFGHNSLQTVMKIIDNAAAFVRQRALELVQDATAMDPSLLLKSR